MNTIRCHGPDETCQRLAQLCADFAEVVSSDHASVVQTVVHVLAHWTPGWVPPERAAGDHSCGVILVCPHPPDPPETAFMAGIDAWLSPTAPDDEVRGVLRRSLARALPVDHDEDAERPA